MRRNMPEPTLGIATNQRMFPMSMTTPNMMPSGRLLVIWAIQKAGTMLPKENTIMTGG